MPVNGEEPAPRPTIRDVAERAGVSKSLVSLVLRGSPKVSPARRALVDQAIADLGYRPNAAARTLREGSSRAIGVLLNDVRHPWFVDLLDGLISVLEADGRHVVLSGGGRLDRRMDDSVLRGFLGLEADGFILAGTQANSPVIAEIASAVPTVTVGWRDIDLPRVDAVANDDLLGATLATRHLIDLGHRRIAHISGRVSGTSNVVPKLRQQGYEDTMRARGLAADRDLRRRRPDLRRRPVGRLGDERRRARQALAGRLRQHLPGPAAVDLAYQRRQRRLRGRAPRRPHPAGPGGRPGPACRTPPAVPGPRGPRLDRAPGLAADQHRWRDHVHVVTPPTFHLPALFFTTSTLSFPDTNLAPVALRPVSFHPVADSPGWCWASTDCSACCGVW